MSPDHADQAEVANRGVRLQVNRRNGGMKIWVFTLQIKDLAEFDDELTDRLFEASCSDGTLGSSCGHSRVDFNRDAVSLDTAIRSAVSDLQECGLRIERADIAESCLLQLVD